MLGTKKGPPRREGDSREEPKRTRRGKKKQKRSHADAEEGEIMDEK
jgi:hypothetical protein